MTMKTILFFLFLAFCVTSCHKTTIGYLQTDEASYNPDSLIIRTELDPVKDATKIANSAPWVTTKIQGVLGTSPINYRIADVEASDGGDADILLEELIIRGAGIMQVPLSPKAPQGRYKVSIEVYNEGYSHIMNNVFTFIIE